MFKLFVTHMKKSETRTILRSGIAENPYYKWEVLALLWFAFFLNQADRQVFNVVLPLIRADLHLTDAQIGFIAMLFNLTLALFVPISGYIGDRFSKKWIIVSSILLWSSATMLTGLSTGILMFILFRSTATGLGEALFGPANYSTIADYHGEDTRASAMSIHQTSYYFGVIVSGFLAGYIGDRWGWRSAFFIFGAVGVLHGLLIMRRLRDKKNSPPMADAKGRKSESISFLEAMRALFKVPTAIILTIGFSGLIFVITGYLTWTPTFLHEKFSMNLADAGLNSMLYTHIAAFVGILLAGRLSDILAAKRRSFRILLQACGLLFAVPFIVAMGICSELWMVYLGLFGFGFGRAFFDANTYPVLYDVIPQKYHSSAAGVMLMVGFGVGSLAPWILGQLSPVIGFSLGISLLSIIWIACSLLLILGYKITYLRDYQKAHFNNCNYEQS